MGTLPQIVMKIKNILNHHLENEVTYIWALKVCLSFS